MYNCLFFRRILLLFIIMVNISNSIFSRGTTIIENMPEVRIFTILDRKMYFVSEEDQMLYRLDYLSKSKSITAMVNVPRNIKFLLSVEK